MFSTICELEIPPKWLSGVFNALELVRLDYIRLDYIRYQNPRFVQETRL